MDALRATLPAGTLSGAPKVRAMQIIDELEPVKRGGYGGAIGYLCYTGDLDTAIHIRTVVVKDGVAHVQAGGGTVADAIPANEYGESVSKARGGAARDRARRARSPTGSSAGGRTGCSGLRASGGTKSARPARSAARAQRGSAPPRQMNSRPRLGHVPTFDRCFRRCGCRAAAERVPHFARRAALDAMRWWFGAGLWAWRLRIAA